MGLIKKIKGSYMFTQFEVGKYTKRRSPSSARDMGMQAGEMTIRPATTEFISEFDRAADEALQEQRWQQQEEERRQRRLRPGQPRTNSIETLPADKLEEAHGAAVRQRQRQQSQLGKYKSSMELSATQRERQQQQQAGANGILPYAALQSPDSSSSQATTAVSTPDASPFGGSADQFGSGDQPIARPRPKGARSARSNMDMQSVYFAPGRNVTMTNQQKQRMSVYPTAASTGDGKPVFDKNSASSVDYYVFSPNKRDLSSMPLDARRRARGVVAPEEKPADALHASEAKAEAERAASTNPFVERRKKAQALASEGWVSESPFTDPLVGSGRGGVDPSDPRKYLNTPLYANQAGSGGVDLLA
ncbi:hypothetical protein LPJ56_006538 [Coemansia sp. RSA 2599]|nr:hypothetical protein LPJ75_006572 [Coemansia sp. RSA 2598]KAJ1805500.1 hypothetical protein LPJ56_006538 [Coemansia sp. RSA 2599]